ncbi:MAG: protoporphyrinogen oxidase [Thiogranum sp.]|nr:protoporphyrinogen oxidase [Thiogranum sp.]
MKKVAIVGGGISGLATAFQISKRLRSAGCDHQLRVFEAQAHVGGKIGAARRDGFLCEAGPNGFLDSKPSTLELCDELGLTGKLLRSEDAASRRYIYSRGQLHALPGSPPAFFRSKLLDLPAKLRIVGELWAPPSAPGSDPTVAEFGRRRLGPQATARLLDPMVSGVFAGDPERLSLGSCFPRIAELEAQYKSLIRAMLALQFKRGARRSNAGPAGPGGTLTSFADGLSVLPATLAERLGEQLVCAAPLHSLQRTGHGYRLQFQGAASDYDCDVAVLALQACDASAPLRALDEGLAGLLQQFEYAPVAVVGLGYEQAAFGRSLDGFGFLVPGEEQRKILGSLWTSSIFAQRAPEGHVLLRTLVGGARNPQLATLSEADLVALVRAELAAILGVAATPVFAQVFTWPQAICQYTVGHRERLSQMDRHLSALPGLFITGNAFRGVALNDCTRNAALVAEGVAEYLRQLA